MATESANALAAERKLRQAADKLVGSVFYGTLLRKMRSSVLTGPYGHGGPAERMFQGQLDQILAERAGSARSTRLTDAIVRRYGDKAKQMVRVRSHSSREQAARDGVANKET